MDRSSPALSVAIRLNITWKNIILPAFRRNVLLQTTKRGDYFFRINFLRRQRFKIQAGTNDWTIDGASRAPIGQTIAEVFGWTVGPPTWLKDLMIFFYCFVIVNTNNYY